ncbi:hypothetical protein B0G81_6809 [Paraburkholderia sp. BL6665CI2N2]|uniref:hypothetical protein n=1 Tax=Paraburkholderia sp. BL6665CI2N2 TaxID=1938806 RepID=UPI0010663515|nr:hypothetical protein [Paraburkholderia sp. BL6665CI2N2]TDY26299.1 hypothetical protein B0G81_6809 [Paraburkholderia sp. BL6665CI2N2]
MPDPLDKTQAGDSQSRECPRYELTEQAYLRTENDNFERLHEEGATIEFRGVPGYHMVPLNDAAKAMIAKHKPKQFDFNKLAPLTA